ncbi:MAG: SRPBCC family protein [Rhodopirellula sp. JB044]|uniref:SRPBCC family protein n=1 Tax=Rhodopirellula sp. JB044 TaxID=3342844 RepID=UPI00370B7260
MNRIFSAEMSIWEEAVRLTGDRRQRKSQEGKSTLSDSSNTVRLHRVLKAPAERIYNAFLDPDALCRWLPPYGFLGKIDHIDPQEGGSYHMSFINFATGHTHSFESKFVELTPNERIRLADKFDDPGLEADMTKTITLTTVSCGTEIEILHEGLPAAIPTEMCYLGWQESLVQLASLVETYTADAA